MLIKVKYPIVLWNKTTLNYNSSKILLSTVNNFYTLVTFFKPKINMFICVIGIDWFYFNVNFHWTIKFKLMYINQWTTGSRNIQVLILSENKNDYIAIKNYSR